jgi:hypothetical protein
MKWTEQADQETLDKTVKALTEHGVKVVIAESAADAKKMAVDIIPQKAEVMTMTSETLREISLDQEINESGNYDAVKPKLYNLNRETDGKVMQQIGAAPDWSIGSVHAVTEDGKVVVASNTGSQLPGYAYGSPHVLWIVGTQKIVKNLDEAMNRIYEHVLPLESERAKKAYGVPGSNVSKIFILNNEVAPDRITMILVKENLGY